ncbi:MAG TPA: carboxylesterase family protein [Caulobacteraceae bacterium]|nr:carboxylesterase family protein [Caulobacteraceae bacterium]
MAVTGGRVAGTLEDGVHVFRGLPFAASIAGANRWRAPQPVAPWDGVRDASRFGQACPQPALLTGEGLATRLIRWKRTGRVYLDAISQLNAPTGGDCLNLNLWTPSLDPQAKLPVLVFIHGGSFTGGSGAQAFYDGRALAKAGLVLVTINYRLGVIGFVGGEDLFPDSLGVANRGFLDQVQALRWVNENIAAFGGDPDCVTVAGESAGATSVLMMAATPATNGLMRRAVSMSGAPLAYPHDECSRFARDYFESLGVKPGDGEALMSLTMQRIFAARPQPGPFLYRHAERYGSLGADRLASMVAATGTDLFPAPPLAFVAGGGKPGLELLIGTCKDECRLWTIALPLPDGMAARTMFNLHAGVMKPRGRPTETFRAYRAAMPGASGTLVRERAMTDSLFRRPSVGFADAVASANPGHAFLYRFDWASPVLGGAFGAIHAIDVPGVFQTYDAMAAVVGPAKAARPAGDAMHAAVTSFAKTGAPAIPGAPAWPAYDAGGKACMVIDETCDLRHAIDAAFEPIW